MNSYYTFNNIVAHFSLNDHDNLNNNLGKLFFNSRHYTNSDHDMTVSFIAGIVIALILHHDLACSTKPPQNTIFSQPGTANENDAPLLYGTVKTRRVIRRQARSGNYNTARTTDDDDGDNNDCDDKRPFSPDSTC